MMGTGGSAGSGTGGVGGGTGGTGGAGGQYTLASTLTIGPFNLAPNQEVTYCVTKLLPAEAAKNITRIESDLLPGSHHLIFYKSADTVESPNPTPCQAFADVINGTVPLYIAESRSSFLDFPQGVAYDLSNVQMYRLEAHYINTTSSPISAMGTVRFYTPTDPSSITDHANLMFYGNVAIRLPPSPDVQTVGPMYHPINDGRKIFGLTTHTHRLGVDASIDLATGVMQPVMQIYDNPNWDNPPLKLLDPPLQIQAGQGIQFTCKYVNTTNQTVFIGEHATDEMCFIWAYYYPDHGFDACTNVGIGRIPACSP
jgi:hypothetical protein